MDKERKHEIKATNSVRRVDHVVIDDRLYELWHASNDGMALRDTGTRVSELPWIHAEADDVEVGLAALENGREDHDDA